MAAGGGCVIESTLDKSFISWRPHTHHRLNEGSSRGSASGERKGGTLFDPRFAAFLKCEKFLLDLFRNITQKHHADLVDDVIDCIAAGLGPVASTSALSPALCELLPVSCITTNLSDADRRFVVDELVVQIESRLAVAVCDVNCDNIDSVHDLLVEAADGMWHKKEDTSAQRKASKRAQATIGSKYQDVAGRISLSPLQALIEMVTGTRVGQAGTGSSGSSCSSTSAGKPTENRLLVFILRAAERILPETMGSLFEVLHGVRGSGEVGVHVVVVNSAQRPLPLRLDKSAQRLIDVSLFSTAMPWELYDELMGQVLTARVLPATFCIEQISWMHDYFWKSNSCVHAILEKMLLCLSCHFLKRRSLLCMFEETRWLQEMKICRKQGNGLDEDKNQQHAISEILSYLSAEDVAGTGLILSRADGMDRSAEVSAAVELLNASLAKNRIEQVWFNCLCEARDKLLPNENAQQQRSGSIPQKRPLRHSSQREFGADVLWAAMRAATDPSLKACGDGSDTSPISNLIKAIGRGIMLTPIGTILSVIQSWKTSLDPDRLNISAIFYTQSSSDAAAASAKWAKLWSDLQDHFVIVEETLEMMRAVGILPSACQRKLPQTRGSAKKAKAVLDLEGAGGSPPGQMRTGQSFVCNGDETSTSRAVPVGTPKTHRKVFSDAASPQSPTATTAVCPTSSPAANRTYAQDVLTSPVGSTSNSNSNSNCKRRVFSPFRATDTNDPEKNGTWAGSLYSWAEIALEEIVEWLEGMVAFFIGLPCPQRISGVLDLDPEAFIETTLPLVDSDFRSSYHAALVAPPVTRSRSTSAKFQEPVAGQEETFTAFPCMPDMCHLAKIVLAPDQKMTENVLALQDAFVKALPAWRPAKLGKRSKRKLEAGDDGDSVRDANVVADEKSREMRQQQRCRFIRAANDLETLGVIKVRTGGKSVTRMAYVCLDGQGPDIS